MYTQTEVLIRHLKAFDAWPTPDQLADHAPAETRELLNVHLYTLDATHLLVLLWLSHFLWDDQRSAPSPS